MCADIRVAVIVVFLFMFKVTRGLLMQDGALLCKAQGGQVIRNAVLMAVMEVTCSLVTSPPKATVFGSWPVKICLNGNSVKGTVCRHRFIYGVVELNRA